MKQNLVTITLILACMVVCVSSVTLQLPLNYEFYAQHGGTGQPAAYFCTFPYKFGNLTLERPADMNYQVNTFLCAGFIGHNNETNYTSSEPVIVPVPGWTIQWYTLCPSLNPNCTYNYQLMATDSTWGNPISSFLNVTLPAQANGTQTFGVNKSNIGQSTFKLGFNYGPGIFFYKEVLSGGSITYGAINISCPLNDDGTVRDSCSIYDYGSSVPAYQKHLSDFISWFTLVLLWISIGGALLTLLTFTVHYEIRTYPIKLIMYLCVCIILGNFFFLMAFETGFQKNDAVCYLTGMTIHGFFLGNFCWTLCIAFNFYQMIVRRNRESESLEKFYHLFSWGLPIFCVEWVGGWLKYGLQGGGVCYVTDPYFLFAFFFLPGLIILALNIILFFFVAREIHDTLASAPASNKQERKKECRVYISICISIGLSWVFGFIMILFTVYWINIIFLFLFTIFTGLQGFLIFISYCVNMKVAGKWAGLLGKCIPFFRRFEHMGTGKSNQSTRDSKTNSSRGGSSTSSGDTSVDSDMSQTSED